MGYLSYSKFLHLYTMSSFLVRTATRPGQTTRLSQNRNHEIPKNPRSESRRQNEVKRPHKIILPRRWGVLLLVALAFLAHTAAAASGNKPVKFNDFVDKHFAKQEANYSTYIHTKGKANKFTAALKKTLKVKLTEANQHQINEATEAIRMKRSKVLENEYQAEAKVV